MPFELESMTKVRVLDVRTLAAKDRKPAEPPGAQLLLQAVLPANSLTMFDGGLAGWLYRKSNSAKQGALDGMEGQELTSIGEHVKRIPWAYEQTGCAIVIDRGLGGKRSNIDLEDCKVHRVSFKPQQGGGVQTQWTVDIPGLSDDVRGKLTGLKATDIQMQLALPEVVQDDIDDDEPPPPKQATRASKAAAAAKDATQTFADAHTDGAAGEKDITGSAEAWPFPGKGKAPDEAPPQSVTVETSRPGSRTARGRDKTKAALDAGALG